MRARLIEGRSNRSEDSRLNASDSMPPERVDCLEDRVVAEPGRRAVSGRALHPHAKGEHALRLNADMQVGGLAGDREVAAQALAHQHVRRAVLDLVGLLVRRADEAHADVGLVGRVANRAHERGQRALHVVGAAADEAVALHAGLELLGVTRDHIEMTVQDHGRGTGRLGGANVGRDHRKTLVLEVRDIDVARPQPALDETGRGAETVDGRGVVGDQALGKKPLVHRFDRVDDAEDRVRTCRGSSSSARPGTRAS